MVINLHYASIFLCRVSHIVDFLFNLPKVHWKVAFGYLLLYLDSTLDFAIIILLYQHFYSRSQFNSARLRVFSRMHRDFHTSPPVYRTGFRVTCRVRLMAWVAPVSFLASHQQVHSIPPASFCSPGTLFIGRNLNIGLSAVFCVIFDTILEILTIIFTHRYFLNFT